MDSAAPHTPRYRKPCPNLIKGVRCPLCGAQYICQQPTRPKAMRPDAAAKKETS